MNVAYKHLEAKLRIGEFTIGQWLALFVGVMTAVVWGFYVSPFGPTLTIFGACYLGGLPAGAIFLATVSDIDLVLTIRSAAAWRRGEARYLAGPGDSARGYVVKPVETDERRRETGRDLTHLDLASLWES